MVKNQERTIQINKVTVDIFFEALFGIFLSLFVLVWACRELILYLFDIHIQHSVIELVVVSCLMLISLFGHCKLALRLFRKYTVNEYGIEFSQLFSRSKKYAWTQIQVDIAKMTIAHESWPVIRIFYGPSTKKWKAMHGLDEYLLTNEPLLLLTFSQDRINTLSQYTSIRFEQ